MKKQTIIAMKNYLIVSVLVLGFAFSAPAEASAQTKRSVAVVKVDRPAKRKIRRTKRRVRRRTVRRTLRSLPAGTRAVVHRRVSYYPVRGRYYVARKGVYVRSFPPVGFRIRTLAVTPVRIVVRNRPYWYAEGVFYQKEGADYIVSETPVGAVVPTVPDESEAFDLEGVPTYELNNAVYQEVEDGYEIIELLDEQ